MQRIPAILLLAIGQTLIWASIYYVFPALLLRWEQNLGWSKSDLTAAISVAVFVSAAASPVAGRIIDRGYGAPLIGLSTVLGGVGLLLLSGVTEQWQFMAAWVLLGLAMSGCLYEPCFALVTRSRGKNAKQAIIFITLVAGFASTISYPGYYTLAEALGWRVALRVVAAVVIFIVAPVQWIGIRKLEADGVAPASTSPGSKPGKPFLKTPAFWFLATGFSFLAITHGAVIHHLLPLLDERGFPAELAILAASFIGPMQVAGRLAMMASENRLSNHSVTIAAFFALSLSLIMLLLSPLSPMFLSGFVILFGSAYGTVSILRPLLAREILGEAGFGAKSGALALFYLAGTASSPFLGSLIWNRGGYDLMLATLLIFALTGCLLYLLANRLSRQQ